MAPEGTGTGLQEHGTENLNVQERAKMDVRKLAENSTASTVNRMTSDVQSRIETDLINPRLEQSAGGNVENDPYAEEVRAAAKGFEDNVKQAGIMQYAATKTDAEIQAFTTLSGDESDITFNTTTVAKLVDGESNAIQNAKLVKAHEQQHIDDPGLKGMVHIDRTKSVNDYQRAEGKAETESQQLINGSDKIIRTDAPSEYVDAQTTYLDLKEAAGVGEGQQILRGVMSKKAASRSIADLNVHLAEQALDAGTTDVETVERQAAEGGYQAQAQRVITRHRFKQVPQLQSVIERLQPSSN